MVILYTIIPAFPNIGLEITSDTYPQAVVLDPQIVTGEGVRSRAQCPSSETAAMRQRALPSHTRVTLEKAGRASCRIECKTTHDVPASVNEKWVDDETLDSLPHADMAATSRAEGSLDVT
jgi:hypothetical protein